MLGHAWWAVQGCSEGPPAVGYRHPTWSSGQVPGREGSMSLWHRQSHTSAARGAAGASSPPCQVGLPGKTQGTQLDLDLRRTTNNISESRKSCIAYLKLKFNWACCVFVCYVWQPHCQESWNFAWLDRRWSAQVPPYTHTHPHSHPSPHPELPCPSPVWLQVNYHGLGVGHPRLFCC